MKGCKPGDVILAPFCLGNSTYPRPLVILSVTKDELLQVCPFTSKRPMNAPAIPCAIHDFCDGGLDLFDDSYILIHEQRTITNHSVRYKKGTLEPEFFRALLDSAPAARQHTRTTHPPISNVQPDSAQTPPAQHTQDLSRG